MGQGFERGERQQQFRQRVATKVAWLGASIEVNLSTRHTEPGKERHILTDEAKPGSAIDEVVFRSPPLVEMVLAVAFEPVQELGVVALGDLWRRYFSHLKNVEEKPRIEMPVEQFDGAGVPSFSFQIAQTVPIPRLWFQDPAGGHLVQIQNNWFARNWRKSDADYPMYPALRSDFAADLDRVSEYIESEGLGHFMPTQCEITYINHIPGNSASDVLGVLGRPQGDLPAPEGLNLNLSYPIRDGGESIGRLHVAASTARNKATSEPIVVLNITSRGRPLSEGLPGALGFLDLGATWCLRAFDQITRPEMHKLWGRVDGG